MQVSDSNRLLDRLAMKELQPSDLSDSQLELLDVMSSALMDAQQAELEDCTATLQQLTEMKPPPSADLLFNEKEKQRRRALNCLARITTLLAVHGERTRRTILKT
jgi:hypothetical protein